MTCCRPLRRTAPRSTPCSSENGREFCGREDRHPYELFLQLEAIEHKRTLVNRPQSNGIVERWPRTLLDEHFRVEGRRTWFETLAEMQTVLDNYFVEYNPNDRIRAAPRSTLQRRHQKGEYATAKPDPQSRLTYVHYRGSCQPISLSVHLLSTVSFLLTLLSKDSTCSTSSLPIKPENNVTVPSEPCSRVLKPQNNSSLSNPRIA
jgi:hypothetical protein